MTVGTLVRTESAESTSDPIPSYY